MWSVHTGKQHVGFNGSANIVKHNTICGLASIGDAGLLAGFWKLFLKATFAVKRFTHISNDMITQNRTGQTIQDLFNVTVNLNILCPALFGNLLGQPDHHFFPIDI